MALSFKKIHEWNPDVNYKHILASITADANYGAGGELIPASKFGADASEVVYVNVPDFKSDAGNAYHSAIVAGKLEWIVSATGVELAAGAYPAGFFDEAVAYIIVKTTNK